MTPYFRYYCCLNVTVLSNNLNLLPASSIAIGSLIVFLQKWKSRMVTPSMAGKSRLKPASPSSCSFGGLLGNPLGVTIEHSIRNDSFTVALTLQSNTAQGNTGKEGKLVLPTIPGATTPITSQLLGSKRLSFSTGSEFTSSSHLLAAEGGSKRTGESPNHD